MTATFTTFKDVRKALNIISKDMKRKRMIDPTNKSYTWRLFDNIVIDTYSPNEYGYGTFQIRLKMGNIISIEKPIAKVEIRNTVCLYPIRNGCKNIVNECMDLDLNMRIDTDTFKKFCNKHFRPFGDTIYNVLNAIGYDMTYYEDEDDE